MHSYPQERKLSFDEYVERGGQLLKYLAMSDEEAQVSLRNNKNLELDSPFHKHADLQINGWEPRESSNEPIDSSGTSFWPEYWPVKNFLKEMEPAIWNQGTWKTTYLHKASLECSAVIVCVTDFET